MARKKVAVVFGGRTCEHEVSILTAHEAMAVLRKSPGYEVIPVYISKDGRWLTGEALDHLDKFADAKKLERECHALTLSPMGTPVFATQASGWLGKASAVEVDVVLPLLHGPNGEDGTLQGALEMLGVPYAGSGVLASALCMNKVAMKRMFACADLPQVPYSVTNRRLWGRDRDAELARIRTESGTDSLFVKPVRGGSSIGVTFVEAAEQLADAIDLALEFDEEAVIETAVTQADEINCAVRRVNGVTETSELELVEPKDGFLTYDQKYLDWSTGGGKGGSKMTPAKGAPADGISGHTIPAPVSAEIAARVKELATTAFDICDCDGAARIDFLLKGEQVYINEINTLPGSLSFYMWEASGVPFDKLLDDLISSAIERACVRDSTTYSLDRNLLADIEARKGAKSA